MELTAPLLLNLFGSSMMAFFLNLTGYKLLQLTSPLTYQIVGHLKTILVLLFGIIYFDNVPSQSVLAGVGLAMLGVIIYNQTSSKKNSSTLVVKSMDDIEEKEEGFGDNEEATETDSLLPVRIVKALKTESRKSVTSSADQNQYVQDRADPIAAAPDLEVQTKGIDLFKEAVRKVGDPSTQWRRAANTDTKLKLYGLFKYAEKGPCVDDSSRPSIWDPVGQRKWDAWKEVGEESFSRDQARAAYVDIVAECMDL